MKGLMLPWDRNREKEMARQKISVQRSGKRQTAWESAPDAVWEGYLIDDITPLFPFSLHLFFLSHTHMHIHKHTHIIPPEHTVFALSPSYPCMTHSPQLVSTHKSDSYQLLLSEQNILCSSYLRLWLIKETVKGLFINSCRINVFILNCILIIIVQTLICTILFFTLNLLML